MKSKIISSIALSLFLAGAALPVTAATISLSPMSSSAAPGGILSFSLVADFTGDASLGGGLDVFFDDTILGFVSFEFADPALAGDDPGFRRSPDLLAGELNGIGFGNFDGLSGVSTIGTLTFEALAAGSVLITMAANEGGPPDNPGGFFTAAGAPQTIDFVGAQATVVPLPAGLVLLLSALGAMGLIRRST